MSAISNQVARFDARSISQGSNVDSLGGLDKFKQVFSSKSQLVVYNPANHQHIATGVSKTQLSSLIILDSSRGLSSEHLKTAEKILTAAGIPHGHLASSDVLKLAVMVTTEPGRAADVAQLRSVNIDVPTTMPTAIRQGLTELSRVNGAAAQLVEQMRQGGTDVTQLLADLNTIAKDSPNLLGRITTLGQQELAGHSRAGSVEYMVSRGKSDMYMADHSSGLDATKLPTAHTLGFEPKFHISLSPEKFQEVSAKLAQVQQDNGLLGAMRTDPATNTVHCGYTYAAFNDIVMGFGGSATPPRPDGSFAQQDVKDIKSAFLNAANPVNPSAGNLPQGIVIERAFGNPNLSTDRQQTRFDAVLDMFSNYQSFDYSTHDGAFTTASMNRLDQTLAGQTDGQKIHELLQTQGFDGFAISENHADVSSKTFLFDNLATLKNEGVAVICIEHLKDSVFADMINTYLQTPPITPMSPDLIFALKNVDRGHTGSESFTGILQKIHDDPACHGLRIVAGDTENLNAPSDPVHSYEVRMGNMNTFAESNLKANLQPGEKYVILAGAAHNNTHLGLNDGMPGFSQALGIPSVVVANVSGSYAMQLDREDVTKRTAATLLRPN